MAFIDTATRSQLIELYVAYFNRAPDADGLAYWSGKVANGGWTVATVARSFMDQTEVKSTYPDYMTSSEIVDKVYTNVLNRAADADGKTYWVNQLNTGKVTKADLIQAVVNAAKSTTGTATDAATLANKTSVGEYFAVTLGSNDKAAAASIMTGVTSDAATVTAAKASSTAANGQTFTLTASGDTLDPNSATAAYKTSSGDDVFRAPTDGFLTSADYIDGGTGNDTLTASITAAGQTIAPVLKSVENVTLTITAVDAKTTTFSAAEVTGATTVTIKDAAAVSASNYTGTGDEVITVSNLAKTTTLGIVGGTGTIAGNTASSITATFASAAAADTQKVAISSKGTVGLLTLATAETVEITATGTGTTGANRIEKLEAAAVKTLNIKGAGDLTIGSTSTNMAATATVNASTSTGAITFTGEASNTSLTFTGGTGATTVTQSTTGTVAITTGAANDTVDVSGANSTGTISVGAGDDEVKVGASSNVTAADTITGGDGTDTITVTDTTINATTKTNLATGVSGFEVLKTTATAETTIDFQALSTYNTVVVAGASGATAAVAATAGNASINVSTMENTDALVVAAARVGQAGGVAANTSGVDTSAVGGNGITITPYLDGGANSATLKFIGNADITGGAGGASAGSAGGSDVGGAGGVGLSAANIETLNIEVVGTNATGVAADTVTIAGGAGGAATDSGDVAGAAGASLVIGTNATINITGSLSGSTAAVYNNLDLGTIATGTNVTVNASTFQGGLTVTATSGNVNITGGLGADVLGGGAGTDVINGGAGNDQITGGAGKDALTGGAGRDAFIIGTEGHSGTTTYDTISDFGKVTTATTATETAAMTDFASFVATATAKGGANADWLDVEGTATLAVAATGTDVSAGVTGGGTITGAITAKGVVTVTGAQAANVDTLAEWVAVTKIMTGAGNAAVFEFNGNTYVFTEGAGTDDLVELTGVTGVTGITLVGSSVAAAVGDIFVL